MRCQKLEVRRLLGLIGGMEPAALQRAAAAYTDIFCAVAEMKGSVAALRPIALAAPCRYAAEPGGWPEAIPLTNRRPRRAQTPRRGPARPGPELRLSISGPCAVIGRRDTMVSSLTV